MKKQPSPRSKQKATAKPAAKPAVTKPVRIPFLETFESFAAKNDRWILAGIFIVSVICSILLFDIKVSIGGDDSSYVERAYNFLHTRNFPFYQGPGYPLMLSMLMGVFGFKIGVFKIFSFIFYTAHIILMWYAFRKKLPYFILCIGVGFIAMNDFMQYYASQTWSEAFFLFLQSLMIYAAVKIISLPYEAGTSFIKDTFTDLKKHIWLWLLFGISFLIGSITKTIAIFAITAPVVYFIIRKEYRFAVLSAGSFLTVKVLYEVVVRSIFGKNNSNQWEQMMLVNAYKPEEGTLTFVALIQRFWENIVTYTSMHFFRIIHVAGQTEYKPSPAIALIVVAFLAFVVYRIFKEKNKYMIFLALYTFIMCGAIFVGIHASNRQDRLIIILIPFILMIMVYGLYLLVKNIRALHIPLVLVCSFMLLASFYHTLGKAPQSIKTLQKNLGKEHYYGYTHDWEHYFEMSEWCAQNLPANSMVACRKSSMSFIATGKQMWYGIYVVDSEDPDVWLKKLKEAKVTHMLISDLRAIPTQKSNRIISTLHKIANFIIKKYPTKLKLIHTIGSDERAYVYEIKYDA